MVKSNEIKVEVSGITPEEKPAIPTYALAIPMVLLVGYMIYKGFEK